MSKRDKEKERQTALENRTTTGYKVDGARQKLFAVVRFSSFLFFFTFTMSSKLPEFSQGSFYLGTFPGLYILIDENFFIKRTVNIYFFTDSFNLTFLVTFSTEILS